MTLFVVIGSGELNLSDQVFQGFTGISFQTNGDLNVILKDTQFGLLALPTDSFFQGSGFVDTIRIGITKDATFLGSSFSLPGWSNRDSFSFYDNSVGSEHITGTQGNDRFYVSGGADHVDGNMGRDDLLVVNWSGLTNNVSGTTTYLTDFSGKSVNYVNIDRFNLTLGSGNDGVITGAGYDVIRSGAGDDTLNSGGGDAQVQGGAGKDLWIADFSDDPTAKVVDVHLTGPQAAGGGTVYQGIERLGPDRRGGR